MRFVLSIVLFAFSVPTMAAGVNPDSVQAQTAATAKTEGQQETEEPKICKRIDSTESRIRAKKVCMTAQQWKEFDDANRLAR